MSKLITHLMSILLGVFALLYTSLADVVINEDLIIQGSQCIGFDCVNGEDFAGDTLRLKENNLLIHMDDSSVPFEYYESWNLSANSSVNGGQSYFNFEFIKGIRVSDGTVPLHDCSVPVPQGQLPPVVGVIPDGEPIIFPENPTPVDPSDPVNSLYTYECNNPLLSDGTDPLYDCSVEAPIVPFGPPPLPILGLIPEGEPIIVPENPTLTDPVNMLYTYECNPKVYFSANPGLYMGAAAGENNVTLGFGSQPEVESVSLGNADLVRQLKHVAAGLADTDMLILQTLNEYSPFIDQQNQVAALKQQLATLETQISAIEDKVYNNRAPTAPVLLAPDNNASGISTSPTLSWQISTDGDGDTLRYTVTVCENQDFSGCTPEVVASVAQSMMLAGLASGSGILLWFGLVMPHVCKRRRYVVLFILTILSVASTLGSGGGGGGAEGEDVEKMSHTVAGLKSATQYYWKVTATDFIDKTDSEERSFTTQ